MVSHQAIVLTLVNDRGFFHRRHGGDLEVVGEGLVDVDLKSEAKIRDQIESF